MRTEEITCDHCGRIIEKGEPVSQLKFTEYVEYDNHEEYYKDICKYCKDEVLEFMTLKSA